MSGSGREVIPQFREWLGGPSTVPGVVSSSTLRYGSGREALPEVREWSGDSP